jgi:hypothetical protein
MRSLITIMVQFKSCKENCRFSRFFPLGLERIWGREDTFDLAVTTMK